MSRYEHIHQELEEHGELIVTLESGDELELHLGNTEFLPAEERISVQGTQDGQWKSITFSADSVEQYEKHWEI